jgi:hypothetical protein
VSKTVDDYVAGLPGWQQEMVAALRRDIRAAGGVTEAFKWGHPIYEAGGPVCLVKAYPGHVTFGFWRGTELAALDARLEAGSRAMAYIKLQQDSRITPEDVHRLVAAGVALNQEKGDPLKAARG